MRSNRRGTRMARVGSVLAAATLLVGVAACSDDDTPNEPEEQIDEGDPDQVENELEDQVDEKEGELDEKEQELDEIEEDLQN